MNKDMIDAAAQGFAKDAEKIRKLTGALNVALDTLDAISREGIDMDTFNEGGIGFEAIQIIKGALA